MRTKIVIEELRTEVERLREELKAAPREIPAGAALPKVTAKDNGKILKVAGGKWAAVKADKAE